MRSKSPRRFAVPVLVSTVAGTVLAAAVAFAVIPDAGGAIHGCRNKRTGALRVIDAPSQRCTAKETALDWNQTGPQGSAGTQGVKGDTGSAGPDGSQGAAGPTGPQGPQGTTGPQGPSGVVGPQGSMGPQGQPGPSGPVAAAFASPLTGASAPFFARRYNIMTSLTLVPGSYVLNGTVRVNNLSEQRITVQCFLQADSSGNPTMRSPGAATVMEGGPGFSTSVVLPLLAAATFDAPSKVDLICYGNTFDFVPEETELGRADSAFLVASEAALNLG